MKTTTNKEYFAYKFAAFGTIFMAVMTLVNIQSSIRMVVGDPNPPEGVALAIATLLAIVFLFFLLFLITQFFIPAATLDDKCFSIKKAILRRMKRIPLEHITDIRYDNWENYLHITYTQDAQQISDKFYLSSLFYEDTRRWLLLELGEALEKYNITLQYGRLRQIDAWP